MTTLTTDEERRLVTGLTVETSMQNPTRFPACYLLCQSSLGQKRRGTYRLSDRLDSEGFEGVLESHVPAGMQLREGEHKRSYTRYHVRRI